MTDKPIEAKRKFFKRDISDRWPIAGSQIKRIGFLRVLVGGGSMYLSIPLFLIIQIAGFIVMMKWIIGPLLGLRDLPFRNYIIIDRYRIEGLSALDKLNCVFCGWANGLSMLMHARLEQLGNFFGEVPFWKKAVIGGTSALFMPLIAGMQTIGIHLIYNILVSRLLGMKRLSAREAYDKLEDLEYAVHMNSSAGKILRYQKTFDLRLDNALEQIESSWCPFKHLDKRKECVYPVYQEKYFEPHQIEEMKKVLQTEGTVSDTKPYW